MSVGNLKYTAVDRWKLYNTSAVLIKDQKLKNLGPTES